MEKMSKLLVMEWTEKTYITLKRYIGNLINILRGIWAAKESTTAKPMYILQKKYFIEFGANVVIIIAVKLGTYVVRIVLVKVHVF